MTDLTQLLKNASTSLSAPTTEENIIPRVNQINKARGDLFGEALRVQQAQEQHNADISAMTREVQAALLNRATAEQEELKAETSSLEAKIGEGYNYLEKLAEQRQQVAKDVAEGGLGARVIGLFKDNRLAVQQEALAQSTRQLVNIKTQKIIQSAHELEQYKLMEYSKAQLEIKKRQEEFSRAWNPETASKALELYNVQANQVYDSVKFIADQGYRKEQVAAWKAQQDKEKKAEVTMETLVGSYLELAGLENTAESRATANATLANLQASNKEEYANVLQLMEARQRAKNLGTQEFIASTMVAPNNLMETALKISGKNVEAFRAAKNIVINKITAPALAQLDQESFDVQGNLRIPAAVYAEKAKMIRDEATTELSAMPPVELLNAAQANLDLAYDAKIASAPKDPAIWGQIMQVAYSETADKDVKKVLEDFATKQEDFQHIWVQPVSDEGGALENGAFAFYQKLKKANIDVTTAIKTTQEILKVYARSRLPPEEQALAGFLEQYTRKKITPDLLVSVSENRGWKLWQPTKIQPFNLFDSRDGYKYFLEREKADRGLF